MEEQNQQLKPGIYAISQPESGRFVPQTPVGVDYLFVSPENDTSKRPQLNNNSNAYEPVSTRYKNVNTIDLSTGNLSPMQIAAGIQIALMINDCEMVTNYYQTPLGKKERIPYDFTEAQWVLTNLLHTITTMSKSKNGMMVKSLRSKYEVSEVSSTEKIVGDQEKKEGKKGWKFF